MTEHGSPEPLRSPATASVAGGTDSDSNPDVRFERSDVPARGVIVFITALALLIVLSGVFLQALFGHYEAREQQVYREEALPLSSTVPSELPSAPRLEGIDPSAEVGRAWSVTTPAEGPPPWFGYNVRVVPTDGPASGGSAAEERDRLAALVMARNLQKVDAKLAELAGKLPVRAGARELPADAIRRWAGESNSGRSAEGKAP